MSWKAHLRRIKYNRPTKSFSNGLSVNNKHLNNRVEINNEQK